MIQQNVILHKALGIGGYGPANVAVHGQYWHLLECTVFDGKGTAGIEAVHWTDPGECGISGSTSPVPVGFKTDPQDGACVDLYTATNGMQFCHQVQRNIRNVLVIYKTVHQFVLIKEKIYTNSCVIVEA